MLRRVPCVPFPDRHRGVDGGEAALVEMAVDRLLPPTADVEAIDHDGPFVKLLRP